MSVFDFIRQYKIEKRKEITIDSYTIYDALLGLTVKNGNEVIIDSKAIIDKLLHQIQIIQSIEKVIDSSITRINDIVQADIYDSELQIATALITMKYLKTKG